MSLLQTMPELLGHNASQYPDEIAFIDGDNRITYRQLQTLCNSTAAWLAGQGVHRGDRVAVWLVNRIEWMAMYFGLSQLGATLVTINTRYRAHEVEYILERSQASMLVLEPSFRKIDFAAVLRDVKPEFMTSLRKIVVVNRGEDDVPETLREVPAVGFNLNQLPVAAVPVLGRPDDLNILFTTSGTTSGPKLVMHNQYTVAVHNQRIADTYSLRLPGVCLLATLPFCGVFGFNAAFGCFAAARPIVIMDTFDGPQAAQLIRQHSVTHIFGSDEMFRRILEQGQETTPFPSLRICGFASFLPGAEEFGRQALKRGMPLYGLYGSSEVQALFSLNPPQMPLDLRLKGGGQPANSGAQIRIRDTETGELLPAGQSGVIEIRSDTNFIGYLNNPQATAKAIDAEGYFSTGDIGYLRPDGGFVYLTRQGDTMRLAGYLVDPSEIENALKQQPSVENAQVVSVTIDGQNRCAAFVIMAAGTAFDEQEMKQALSRTLAPFKVPARLWAVAGYPTTQSANGSKVQRAKLREMAQERIKEAA